MVWKLAVDKNLARLARKLLILGIDTYLRRDGERVTDFLDKALREDRVVVTTSKQTYRISKETKRYKDIKIILSRERDQELLLEKLKDLGLETPWHLTLTRCTVCNLPLKKVNWQDYLDLLPEHVKLRYLRGTWRDLWICPGCGRIYWSGSHYRSMFESVKKFISS